MEALQGNIIGELLRGNVELTNRLFRTLGLRELNCVRVRVRHVYIYEHSLVHIESVWTLLQTVSTSEKGTCVRVRVRHMYIYEQFSPH